ncbi:hypothetical protein NliqN6_1423 [Naganishia liquefaciens]|uniref:Structural maintenance of chromosomes protein n=1 Tax=Naganishia liquefaciens TaxID=104408 RepID=A0A8H3TPL3_9TREE|nr:hypothetical protein NliqN6_1423 [Naganishia liquefaciens]
MRIEELILEGFKSYPVRTTITGWDPSFNAITGLNGSGKSNILDAICFVLGITNMTAVRANNLMDLIYKRGQAGVTKASVTVVFDNSDRANSPLGFEDAAQITVTRQVAVGNVSKYLLNGHKATLQQLQTLFQSVQLNINNPNFLVMQGKITKVLNMKPPEILGMVEEAAGTRMFEDRKDKALKTIAKKDKKVEELNNLLQEEVEPKLEKLREEKRSYLAYQKMTSELERLTRLVKAYEWTLAVKKAETAAAELKARQKAVETCRKDVERCKKELQGMEKDIEDLQKKRDKEMTKGGKVQALANTVNDLDREIVKLKTQLEMKQSSLNDEQKRISGADKNVREAEAALSEKRASYESDVAAFAGTKQEYDTAINDLAKTEELLQTLITGLGASSNEDGEAAGGYMGQLADAKALMASAASEAEQAKMKIGLLEREIKEKEPRAKKAAKDGEGLTKEYEAAKEKLEALRASLSKMDWDENRERELSSRRSELDERIAGLVEVSSPSMSEGLQLMAIAQKRDALKSRLATLDFSYSNPYPNFDRSKVKGLVANLINLEKNMYHNSTALEICAGGRLYNVVVEDEKVGSALLDKGKLRKRVTIIPLNKINAFRMSAEKLATAERLAPGKVNLALSLIGYDDDVAAAMAYVFGDMLICADKEAAQKVTFNKAVGVKSVTLEGDVYDPSGTLSGGAAPSSSGILQKVQQLNALEKEINTCQRELAQINKELSQAKATIDAYRKAKRELDLKEHEVSLLEQQVQNSNAAKLLADVAAGKEELVKLRETIEESKAKQKQSVAECKRLEKEMADFKNNKDSKLKQIKADIADRKKAIAKQTGNIKSRQKEFQTAELEIEQLESDIKTAHAEVKDAKASHKRVEIELNTMQDELAEAQSKYSRAEERLKKERAVLTAFDDELADLEEGIKSKKQEVADNELNLKKYEHDIALQHKERSSADGLIENLEAQFPWIKDEQKHFGKPNSPYDFGEVNLAQAREKCRELEGQQKTMGRKINNKVMGTLDNVEKWEQNLKKNMSTVDKDKGKLVGTIEELDRYKRDALMKTWKSVNDDFGLIFSELLPGNFAKLEVPEGKDITQGLEVKVRLGQVWKQSLTELSGGQRSLIALSLIMAISRFKPAPIYIFDEIDAALDLNMTSNLGRLFGTRFKGTQFIIVSLKEGLFTGANVLFKARFRDGTSIVERVANRSKGVLTLNHDKENQAPEEKARGAAGTGKRTRAK